MNQHLHLSLPSTYKYILWSSLLDNALVNLLRWVSVHHVVYGSYENRVSIVALAKLLQHGVNTNDTRLQDITVAGDMVRNLWEMLSLKI